jgi:Lon protease-like protein
MVNDALSSNRLIGLVQPDNTSLKSENSIYPIGCCGRITSFVELDENNLFITLSGLCRFEVAEELNTLKQYRRILANWDRFSYDLEEDAVICQVNRAKLIEVLDLYFKANQIKIDWLVIQKMPNYLLINFIAVNLSFTVEEKQILLEAPTLMERSEVLIALIEMSLINYDPHNATKH